MTRVAVVGLGKMGLSHLSIIKAHPDVELAAVCDTASYLPGVLNRYTGVSTYSSLERMLAEVPLDAVIIATPSTLHGSMVRDVLARDVNVFCEKPFCVDARESAELTAEAQRRNLVTQVGYHNRFVAAFGELKRLLEMRALGEVTHILAEAYGPVVLKPQSATWRSKAGSGGGCLYDYAAHPLNLVNWYLGEPIGVGGTSMDRVFSRETEDRVASTLYFDNDATAQLSVNWSDDSVRKMTTRVTVWGTNGRAFADRQECQVYLTGDAAVPDGYRDGWNVRYTTDLTPPVGFYVRGEEYSSQLEYFIERVRSSKAQGTNDFASAAITDDSIAMLIADAAKGPSTTRSSGTDTSPPPTRPDGVWTRFVQRRRRRPAASAA